VREHWREIGYWRWLWQRVPAGARLATVGILLLALLGGGWVAADKATSQSKDAKGDGVVVVETTVQKAITVREKGQIVRKLVPVVKKVEVRRRGETVYATESNYVTHTVTGPGGTVTHTVSQLVPVVTTRQITVNGKPRIVVSTRLQPTTSVVTETAAPRTVVATQNVTQNVTQTAPPVTALDTRTVTKVQTQTQTQTQTVVQVQTVTNVVTQVDTQVVTKTETVPGPTDTVTVPGPERTVTVTVTVPGGGGGS
jgi:hypothetical protein